MRCCDNFTQPVLLVSGHSTNDFGLQEEEITTYCTFPIVSIFLSLCVHWDTAAQDWRRFRLTEALEAFRSWLRESPELAETNRLDEDAVQELCSWAPMKNC